MKITVRSDQCWPIGQHIARMLRDGGFDAIFEVDEAPTSRDVLWYVGNFGIINRTVNSYKALNPHGKVVLQWAGSDILWSTGYPDKVDSHLAPCENWAREVSEKFNVQCQVVKLTPIRVHPLTPLPELPRVLIYGHWDANGGAKYQLPMILEECRKHGNEAQFHVIGDGWRNTSIGRTVYHQWITDLEEKIEFFKLFSALIYMPKPHEQHKYGGFVSLTPVEFCQMGRHVLRNGDYPYMVNGQTDFPAKLSNFLIPWADDDACGIPETENASRYYSHEYAPEKFYVSAKEVLKQLE